MNFSENGVLMRDGAGGLLMFQRPRRVLCGRSLSEVLPALREAEAFAAAGGYAAGWVAYEAAPAFDPALAAYPPGRFPLLWFGLYPPESVMPFSRLEPSPEFLASPLWRPDVALEAYFQKIAVIKAQIAAGATYQVNYTFRMRTEGVGDPQLFFETFFNDPACGGTAFIRTSEHAVCSASPELFFELDGERVVCRPMKGTRPRGVTPELDRALAAALAGSVKDRAENVMIADMIRNDLGRIAEPGGVRTVSLFDIEPYPSVWQMTSTVEARTRAGVVEIFQALFPCASITGAPKVQTSRIIRDLEPGPRGIYTGALGYIAPDRKARFQVAIRTAWVDLADGTAEYGTGSGIVWDSDPASEYVECRVKTRTVQPAFRLIETLLYVPGEGFLLRAEHVRRLERSARELGFIFDRRAVDAVLDAVDVVGFLRVRLLLDESGAVELETTELEKDPRNPAMPWRVGLAVGSVASNDLLLRHKTTRRGMYERARAEVPEVDEVLLCNERGELTEGTITNLVLELEGRKWTPPVECGVLPGVFREKLLAEGLIQERVLMPADLALADRVWLINSVRGWIPAVPAADSFS